MAYLDNNEKNLTSNAYPVTGTADFKLDQQYQLNIVK